MEAVRRHDGQMEENAEAYVPDDFHSRFIEPLLADAYGLAFGMLQDREAAEDVLQEAALSAWKARSRFDPTRAAKPWFLTVVANRCRSVRRDRWWSVIKGGVFESRASPDPQQSHSEDLRQAIRSLPLDQRLVIVLHFYMDMSLNEVAEVAGVPEGTVKSRLHRGLQRLEKYLDA